MKTDKGYRYSIIFAADSAERVRVGEFLEGCGHKKGQIIVEAVSAYLDSNPELLKRHDRDHGNVQLVVKQTLTQDEIERIVRDTIRNSGMALVPSSEAPEQAGSSADQQYVDTMVSNLSEFFN